MWKGHIITFTPILEPSTVTSYRSKDTKGVTHSHLPRMKRGEKRQEHIFVCQQVASARPAWQARFQSQSCKKCQECFHLCSFSSPLLPLHLFWSCLPLWVVVIGRAVYLLSAGLEAVTFEMLSLWCLNRCRQTWNQQVRGEKGAKFSRNIWLMFEPNVWTSEDCMVYLH